MLCIVLIESVLFNRFCVSGARGVLLLKVWTIKKVKRKAMYPKTTTKKNPSHLQLLASDSATRNKYAR